VAKVRRHGPRTRRAVGIGYIMTSSSGGEKGGDDWLKGVRVVKVGAGVGIYWGTRAGTEGSWDGRVRGNKEQTAHSIPSLMRWRHHVHTKYPIWVRMSWGTCCCADTWHLPRWRTRVSMVRFCSGSGHPAKGHGRIFSTRCDLLRARRTINPASR